MPVALIVLLVLVVALAGLYLWTRIAPRTVRAEIEIDASPDRVWEVLVDFAAYPEWNPFIVSAAGEARTGARLTNRMANGDRVMTFTPKVLVAEPGRELRWLGRLGVPGLTDGEHYFRIEPAGDGRSRLVQGERFTGVLVPFLGRALDVADGFAAMNAALKARVEKMPG
ncbi:SRPBCC domain-containing protein [Actinomadura craniellae]|uniref:SRPBCC domain-containing protein n=1 Tax=Actinomadura craniellae TaxID=2231787 RepID=A0A365H6Q9_9ACTN|nr:SRPBCC domain-containing protein [Actinomadura craniellae]RAY14682.1 SRPBCC domain-containing protein [Actinomadura craniellae]